MKLYNANIDRVENIKRGRTVEVGGMNMYLLKMSEEDRNSVGFYNLSFLSQPNSRYYGSEPISELVGNLWTTSYTPVAKELGAVKSLMAKDLFEAADKYEDEAKVDTGLGFRVKGNAKALVAFAVGTKRGLKEVRDENFTKHSVSVPQMAKIVSDIEDNAIVMFDTKGSKFDEFMAFQTIDECILYEATPYGYTYTQEDEDNDIEGNIVAGETTTRYRNNVKEWLL